MLQITDLHLRQDRNGSLLGVETEASFLAVLGRALEEATPDAILITGDVAHDPDAEVYTRFEQMLAMHYQGPTLVLAGNHDVSKTMGTMGESRILDLPGWAIVALDSHVDDHPSAEVDADEFTTLKSLCEIASDRHTLVATHHPPIDLDCPWLDKDRIQNGAELLEWLSEHSTVRAMVFGHAHQEVESAYRNIALLGTPSTCIQFAPRTPRFSVDETAARLALVVSEG